MLNQNQKPQDKKNETIYTLMWTRWTASYGNDIGKVSTQSKLNKGSSKKTHIKNPLRVLWKLQLPIKITVFMWLLLQNKLFTIDNLAKRGGCR
jgi:zinc-binding in reverse transcriptase